MPVVLLRSSHGHLFAEVDDELWVVDTGSPLSFGRRPTLAFGGEVMRLTSGFHGLNSTALSELIGVDVAGLLGTDVLNRFDHLLDPVVGTLESSSSQLPKFGIDIPLGEVMGVPTLTTRVRSTELRMFFDTGAMVSYLQTDAIGSFPALEPIEDFYPGFGRFQTDTHLVELDIAGQSFTLRCGQLPGLIGATLAMVGTDGIVGNEVVLSRRSGYFPRRRLLCLQ